MAVTTPEQELDEARERLQGEHPDGALFDAPSQLSFDLGTGRRATPDFATLKIAGQLSVSENLLYAQTVHVTVTDHHGEVLTEGSATVGYPAFKDHYDKYGGKSVERIHTATLDAA